MSKIILASASKARKSMLENAGVEFAVIPANIDEGEIIKFQKKEYSGPENISLWTYQALRYLDIHIYKAHMNL